MRKGLLSMLLVMWLLCACGADVNTNVVQSAATIQPTVAHFAIGDIVHIEDRYLVTVNRIQTSSGSVGTGKPNPGDVFLFVDIAMKNTTAQKISTVNILMWRLYGRDGEENKALVSTAGQATGGGIAPGTSVRIVLAYEIAATSKHFTLVFQEAIWDIAL